ncbi:DNA polymerase III subunit beta [Mesorhizobium retamae]|uniref:Beta sliding clamp n=1 Tax=Mesorhizobium retamae TaxID=2912854 RepID=A0ABS9QIC7_9HYPH|nr:DNA polymerase III subunit beta [Mesorhizobium sp. IRAMC:0171]
MKVARTDFARLLSAVAKVVESRNTIPILATVCLVAEGGTLTATATDLDIEISGSIAAEGDFAACLDAKLLTGIVTKVAGDEITIEQGDGTATLRAGRSKYNLQTLPVDDMPSMAVDGFTAEFTEDLAALFAPVQFAISTEETRYYLNGIFLKGAVDTGSQAVALTAVATDGHRLAKHVASGVSAFDGIIVPRKTVGLVPKGNITVRLSASKIQFVADGTTITSKLIDGTYPDYQRVIPSRNDKIVTFSGDDMARAAGRVSVISSERGRAVKVEVVNDQATLSVNNPDSGNASEDVIVSYANEEPITVGFNSAYLGELVGIFPPGDVKMALSDGAGPVLFTSDNAPNLLAVLMPMRVH